MAAATTDPLERLESVLRAGSGAPRKRMRIIVNPYATTVSDRLKNLVVYALRGRYQVDAVDTESPAHATEVGRESAREGYDVVVAFGGDGTVNEAANGLAGSDTPLTCLPGGRTNVYCRMLGIPTDVVDATEQLLRTADDWQPRWVDLGHVRFGGVGGGAGVGGAADEGAAGGDAHTPHERKFLFSAGVGLDASVVEQVEAHPRLKARFGEWYYTTTALRTFSRRYLFHPPRLEAELGVRDGSPAPAGGAEWVTGVTVIVQNGAPYTYFGNVPVHMGEGAALDSGDLAGVVLERASPIDIPTIIWRALSKHVHFNRHRQVHAFTGLTTLRVRSLDNRPLPMQADGDYIGEASEAEFGLTPAGLLVVA